MRPRLTIFQGMGVVLLSALGITALARATLLWANIIYTLAVFLFIIAAVGAACARRQTRAFCLGALLGGAGYVLALVFSGSSMSLLTSMAVEALYPRLHSPPASPIIPGINPHQTPQATSSTAVPVTYGSTAATPATPGAGAAAPGTVVVQPAPRYEYEWRLVKTPLDGPTQENFESIAHTLVTLFVAACGGYLARSFHRRHSDSLH